MDLGGVEGVLLGQDGVKQWNVHMGWVPCRRGSGWLSLGCTPMHGVGC